MSDAPPDSLALRCVGGEEAWRDRDEVEPYVASSPVDGERFVAAWMVRAPGGPGVMQSAVSGDGGASWSVPVTLPFGECAGGGAGAQYTSDPWVSIGGDARIYISAIEWLPGADGAGDRVSRLVVTSSPDGMRWSAQVVVSARSSTGATHDNTAIAAAPGSSGLAYLASTRFSGGTGPAGLARTSDGGATWSALEPLTVPGPGAPIALAPQPLIGRDPQEVWLAFAHDPRGARVAMVHSTDGGSTWGDPVAIASWNRPSGWPTWPGTADRLQVAPDIVSAGIDRGAGSLWIVHQSSGPDLEATIALECSVDGGRTWKATPVLDVGEVGWRPTLAVTPGGTVAVTWYAPARDATSAPEHGSTPLHRTLVRVAFFRPTGDGGAELLERGTLDRFDWLARRDGSRFLGDYQGLAATSAAVVAVYARSTADGIRVHAVRVAQPGREGT